MSNLKGEKEMKKQIEQSITTLEIAEMMEVPHYEILKKLDGTFNPDGSVKQIGIIPVLTDGKIPVSDYFIESTYKDASGKENKCYKATKLGCDMLANKFTGEKGITFTARYVKRFHDMEDIIQKGEKQWKMIQTEPKRPPLTAVTSAAKFLTELAGEAGCDRKIQLLAAKSFYNTNGYSYQLEIGADKQYWDTVHIARQVGICVKSSGKPADKAVNEIIRRIGVTEEDYTDTWESKGNWQGTVRKYSDSVIERVKCWIADNDYPEDIDYRQNNGEMKAWHVTYQSREVA